jgi:hypothetical protein
VTAPTPADDTFVMVPLALLDMVADQKISKNAAVLYVVLLSFVNHKRGDFVVWPSREMLAARLGVNRLATVDAPMAELKAAGLVTTVEQRIGAMRSRNLYTLHLTCSARSTVNRTTDPPAETPPAAGDGAVRKTAQRSTENRAPVVRKTVYELDLGFELDQEDQNLSLAADAPPPPAGAAVEDRESDTSAQDSQTRKPATDTRHRVLADCGVTGDEAEALIPVIERRNKVAGRGWWRTVAEAGDLPGLIDEARVELARGPMFGAGPVPRAVPPWCGRCDARTRMVDVEAPGKPPCVAFCPACNVRSPNYREGAAV